VEQVENDIRGFERKEAFVAENVVDIAGCEMLVSGPGGAQ
jgi:hypothetical protein